MANNPFPNPPYDPTDSTTQHNPLDYDLSSWLKLRAGWRNSWGDGIVWREARQNRLNSAAHAAYVEAGVPDPLFHEEG